MVTADVSVRIAWPADAAGIAAIQARDWEQRYATTPPTADLTEAWRSSLARPPQARHRALVALAGDAVVGFALTVPAGDPDCDPSTDGEILELTVDPARLGQGHGSRLLQACADTLVSDRFARAVCWVEGGDDTRRRFLTSAGWGPDGASRELASESDAERRVRQVRLHTELG